MKKRWLSLVLAAVMLTGLLTGCGSTKKILALTFSVNASYKIKKDVSEQLPNIIKCNENEAYKQTDKIVVSNHKPPLV